VQEGTTLRAIVDNRPKVRFWPDGNISPGNYWYKWYYRLQESWDVKAPAFFYTIS
jgi:hypothetical protein